MPFSLLKDKLFKAKNKRDNYNIKAMTKTIYTTRIQQPHRKSITTVY